ncbi:DNA topoisomerase IB [Micromonospora sp. HUAS LYJ1]|uniref:DNA topoisomerase IB n=1 Tax=Micromonospora sp. HUAS LYJ1 TaxID=3061626 RepID=UPI00267249D7|nr:DNA topoisomerase IB [Micromonospora sp. HUAS LYJ1]WKU05161.1 DNA topoisomerase IB [Micromonospora sp. HUAS LYJ1]
MRLRRSDPGRAGYGRRRSGKGWTFLDRHGERVRDPDTLAWLGQLVIPPAWSDVWIAPYPNGHILATGTDAAGRRQYLYHPQWRRKRDEAKFDHVLEVARRLPTLRERVAGDLAGRGLNRDRVLATVARLLDMGTFRVGNEQYAVGEDATFGVSTLRPEHARCRGGCVVFEFPAKGGIEQVRRIEDPQLCQVLTDLRRRRRTEERLFGYWDGRAWRDVRSDEVNGYLRDASGGEMTAKDFRTWHATVRAATELATVGTQRSVTARRRAVAGVMRAVAELLGNTPTVARTSYVDPRVVDLYHDGVVLPVPPDAPREQVERSVLELLAET